MDVLAKEFGRFPMSGGNLKNEYAEALGPLYDRIPKAVLAAVVVSLLSNGGDELEQVSTRLLSEWGTLYHNRIVPQPPVKG